MPVLFRYLHIWLAQLRYSITRELMFKGNFLIWVFVELIWFVLQLTLVEVIYGHTNSVAGWSKYEMMMLVGVNHVVQQLFQAFLMVNCFNLPDRIRTGTLDFFLALPASTQFLVSTRTFDPGALVNALIGAGICAHAAGNLGIIPTPLNLCVFVMTVVAGVALHYSLLLSLVTISFWIVRSQGLIYGYYNLFQIARIPPSAFHGLSRVVFTYVLPMLLVASVPSGALLNRPSAEMIALLLGLSVFFLACSSLVFRMGLRRYGSTGS